MAEKNRDVEADEAAAPVKKSGKKKFVLIGAIALLLAAGVAGSLYFTGMLGGGAKEHKVEKPAPKPMLYYAFEQPLTVNFETDSGLRFLQVQIEVMAREQTAIDALKLHLPVIKNNLILLFSSQKIEDLISREGKERIRQATLSEIQSVMKQRVGTPGIEEVYFTSFVMQ